MTETSVHRKLKAGDVDLDLIQSLLTQVYWTRHDQTAYVKLGLAVRLSQQLRLDFPGQATPADDILPLEQQRQKAYSQRMVLGTSWIWLVADKQRRCKWSLRMPSWSACLP